MKTCVVWGDMASDKASEQYPTVSVCDACVLELAKAPEKILNIAGRYDPMHGDQCYYCEKTKDEEDAERS